MTRVLILDSILVRTQLLIIVKVFLLIRCYVSFNGVNFRQSVIWPPLRSHSFGLMSFATMCEYPFEYALNG